MGHTSSHDSRKQHNCSVISHVMKYFIVAVGRPLPLLMTVTKQMMLYLEILPTNNLSIGATIGKLHIHNTTANKWITNFKCFIMRAMALLWLVARKK